MTRNSTGVQAFKIIRQKLGHSRYKMAQCLGISQTQYDYLEQKARMAQISTLLKLWRESGMSGEDFLRLLEKEGK